MADPTMETPISAIKADWLASRISVKSTYDKAVLSIPALK